MGLGKLIVGNWKMNGLSAAFGEATAIAKGVAALQNANLKVVICPPATLIAQTVAMLKDTAIGIGGQDCHTHASGAHTGDISAHMLADAGASYVIVGHSERRTNHQETDVLVQKKAQAAIAAGLLPIICVGESEAQRDAGAAETIVLGQVEGSIPADALASGVCIAYEPVWAIGTGRTPVAEDVRAIHAAIRAALVKRFGDDDGQKIAILYGGSVNGANASELLAIENVNGALVGGASLSAANFLTIIKTQA